MSSLIPNKFVYYIATTVASLLQVNHQQQERSLDCSCWTIKGQDKAIASE